MSSPSGNSESEKESNHIQNTTEKCRERNSLSLILRNADWQDVVLMALGTLGAIGDGVSTNCLLIFVTHLFNSLGYGKTAHLKDHGNYFMDEIEKVS